MGAGLARSTAAAKAHFAKGNNPALDALILLSLFRMGTTGAHCALFVNSPESVAKHVATRERVTSPSIVSPRLPGRVRCLGSRDTDDGGPVQS